MGEKKATIKDVAKEAGVSISVVSYILNNTPGQSFTDETRKRVISAAKKLNYTPNYIAKGMRSRRSMNIGIVLYWNISDVIVNEMLKGISKITEKYDYNIVLCLPSENKNQFSYIDAFKQRQVDGIIFVSPFSSEGSFDEMIHINTIKKEKVKAVIINGSTNDQSLNYINIDFYNSTYLAAKHLVKLHHKKIAYLMPKNEIAMHQKHERLKGFNEAISESNCEGMIINMDDLENISQSIKIGNGTTAVVLNKINYAVDFYRIMQNKGIEIPDDISVIAASDNGFAQYLIPALTTVKIPLMQMGEIAAKTLLDLLNGKDNKAKIKLSNSIIERESCKKLIY